MDVPSQTGEEAVGVRRVLDHCCMPQLTLIQASACEKEMWTNENACLVSFGETKSCLAAC